MTESNLNAQFGYPTEADVWEFLRTVLGNVILLLILVGAEHLFFGAGFYASLMQHPFWIVILIAAVHDGLFVGVLVAISATVLMDWPARPAEADITAHYIQVAILPLQWLLAALCIGLFRQAELRRARASGAEMARLRQVNEVLASDITKIEAEMNRTQLTSLLREGPNDTGDSLVSRILELQAAGPANLMQAFCSVAELCTSLPVSVLVRNIEGDFDLLGDDQPAISAYCEPPLTSELVLKLRTMSEIILPRTALLKGRPDCKFTVLVGVRSPNHRTLYGAVALLAVDRKAADEAVSSARFLASQLVPVLARIRSPTIVVATDDVSQDNRVRKLFGG